MNHLVDQYFDSLSDKKVAVLGIGVSNRPLIRMLLARGIHVLACDKTPREKLDPEVLELERLGAKLHLGDDYLTGISGDVAFRTPGLHPNKPELQALLAEFGAPAGLASVPENRRAEFAGRLRQMGGQI